MYILMIRDHSGYKAGEIVQVDGGVLEMILDDGAGVVVNAPEPVEEAKPVKPAKRK